MKKLLSGVCLLLSSISVVMVSTATKANAPAPVPGIDTLKQNVVKSFLQKANDPKSSLHKKLVQLNQEKIDGRNTNGVLPKTLTSNNIQVISISGEDQFGRYCHGIANKPDNFECENGVSETYLVLITYKFGVHKATEYESFKFAVKAEKTVTWKIDTQEKEYDRHESIKIEEPVEAVVQAGAEKY